MLLATFHGSTALLAEGAHQALDLSLVVTAWQHVLATFWNRLVEPRAKGLLAFGPLRLALLLRLAITVCAIGAALFVMLEAFLQLANHAWNRGKPPSTATDAENVVTEVSHRVANLATLNAIYVAWALRKTAGTGSRESNHRPTAERRLVVRVVVLQLSAFLSLHNGEVVGSNALPGWIPPLLRVPLTFLMESPDAVAGTSLAAMAVHRGWLHAGPPVRMLLQEAPPKSLVPDFDARLSRIRDLPGVLSLRDVQFWALDETRATGSLVVMAREDANAQQILNFAHRALEGGALADVTVSVKQDNSMGYDLLHLGRDGGANESDIGLCVPCIEDPEPE